MPQDYRVDGLLIMGSWDVTKYTERVRELLGEIYPKATMTQMSNFSFLRLGYEININGKRVWFFVVYGGALLSEFTDLACMLGSRKNILVGLCGGLKPGAKSGDVVLPTASFKDGSMSTMYDLDPIPDVATNDTLRDSLKKRLARYTIHEGRTMTCQAMLCESWKDVQDWSKQGYVAVEMEAATLLAVSKHYNVAGAAILSIADNLIEQETVLSKGFMDLAEFRAKVRDEQFRAALEELAS